MVVVGAAELRAALPFAALVPALRAAFAAGCEVPARHVHAIGERGSTLLMPAWRLDAAGAGRYGVKIVNVFPGNGALGLPGVNATYSLFDAATGAPLAVMDGSELTARRTAAASALAASFLARQDATRLVLFGAGRVAALTPEALRCVRPALREVGIFNRSPAAAEALAATLRERGFDAQAGGDPRAALQQAHIVSCATLSTRPLLNGAWLAPGTHLDLIGSFTPTMREADAACVARSRVFIDTEEALAKAGCLLQAQAEGAFDPATLQATLAQLCRGQRDGRRTDGEITLFKSVGTALEDLAAAELAWAALDNRRSAH